MSRAESSGVLAVYACTPSCPLAPLRFAGTCGFYSKSTILSLAGSFLSSFREDIGAGNFCGIVFQRICLKGKRNNTVTINKENKNASAR